MRIVFSALAMAVVGALSPMHNVATMAVYPGSSTALTVTGSVSVEQQANNELKLTYDLAGLEAGVSGGLHIHVGRNCSDAGGHYYNGDSPNSPDPWNTTYTSNSAGVAQGEFTIAAGITLGDTTDRTIVVHQQNGTIRAACGVVEVAPCGPFTAPPIGNNVVLQGDLTTWDCELGNIASTMTWMGVGNKSTRYSIDAGVFNASLYEFKFNLDASKCANDPNYDQQWMPFGGVDEVRVDEESSIYVEYDVCIGNGGFRVTPVATAEPTTPGTTAEPTTDSTPEPTAATTSQPTTAGGPTAAAPTDDQESSAMAVMPALSLFALGVFI